MTTLSMVLAAVLVCIVIGVPLGILAARSDRFAGALRPVLDVMQTTPAFVYLVPVVMLFSIGTVAGVIATIIFALPPLIRLTNLGIRGVPEDVVEAGHVAPNGHGTHRGGPGPIRPRIRSGTSRRRGDGHPGGRHLGVGPPGRGDLQRAALRARLRRPAADLAREPVLQGEDTDAAVLAMAQEWVETNRDAVDGWLDEARAAVN
jgi:hypothetical protein